MGYFTNRYFADDSGETLEHSANKKHAAYGTANSVSSDRGGDGKKNNTSEYNHKYYTENKDKWSDNKKSKKNSTKSHDDDLYYDKDGKARFGHKDYDENDEDFKRTDGKKIEGSNLTYFTNKNGSTIVLGKGIKFSFPPGTKITTAMAKQLANIDNNNDGKNKEAYVAKMLNAVTGFADKQKLNTNVGEKKKSSGSSKKTEEKKESSSSSSSKSQSNWDKIVGKYTGEEPKKKTSSELKSEAQSKGKSQTDRAKQQKKKKTKQNSQFMHSDDLGSILIKDLDLY